MKNLMSRTTVVFILLITVCEVTLAQNEDPTGTATTMAYGLAAVIAAFTGLGSIGLVWLAFRPNGSGSSERRRLALHMIAIALIVEAVLICGILGIDSEHYETLYAAIAGYVLGTIPSPSQYQRPEGK